MDDVYQIEEDDGKCYWKGFVFDVYVSDANSTAEFKKKEASTKPFTVRIRFNPRNYDREIWEYFIKAGVCRQMPEFLEDPAEAKPFSPEAVRGGQQK